MKINCTVAITIITYKKICLNEHPMPRPIPPPYPTLLLLQHHHSLLHYYIMTVILIFCFFIINYNTLVCPPTDTWCPENLPLRTTSTIKAKHILNDNSFITPNGQTANHFHLRFVFFSASFEFYLFNSC
jgi:hypothetical protein